MTLLIAARERQRLSHGEHADAADATADVVAHDAVNPAAVIDGMHRDRIGRPRDALRLSRGVIN
jgi:hypothetical protein